MPIDVEIVAGGVWLRIVGAFDVDSAVKECLSATELKGFVPDGKLLIDGREALVETPSAKVMQNFVERDVPQILEAMPHWGLLTVEVEQWELGRDVMRRSRSLESVEFFNDLASGLRWLTDTE